MNKTLQTIIKLEGNKLSFRYKGLECEVLRMTKGNGHLCGYVTTKRPLTEDEADSIRVHGGITYHEGNVVGFDCAHYMDLTPNFVGFNENATYRTMGYVKREVKRMVDYIKRCCKWHITLTSW